MRTFFVVASLVQAGSEMKQMLFLETSNKDTREAILRCDIGIKTSASTNHSDAANQA